MFWMKNEQGDEIRVDAAQIDAFAARGFALFEKPAEPAPKVTRAPGRQPGMGVLVAMEKGRNHVMADPKQVEAMEAAGWRVSERQPEFDQPEHTFRPLRGRDPVVPKFEMHNPESGAVCRADDTQVAVMQAAGWVLGPMPEPEPEPEPIKPAEVPPVKPAESE